MTMRSRAAIALAILVLLFSQSDANEGSTGSNSGNADTCSEDQVQKCLSLIISELDHNKDMCKVASKTYSTCLEIQNDSCLNGPENQDAQNTLDRIRRFVAKECSDQDDKKCLDDTEDERKKCTLKGYQETLKNYKNIEDQDGSKIKCLAYVAISECEVEVVRKICGEGYGEKYYHIKRSLLPERIRKVCEASGLPAEVIDIKFLKS